MTRRGRKPSGPKLLDKFTASPRAYSRMRVILETLSGEKTIADACAALGIGEAMFHRIRDHALAAGLDALEAKPMGRPRTVTSAQPSRLATLEQEQKDLKMALHTAEVRAEIAQSMPHLLSRKGRSEKKKKTCSTSERILRECPRQPPAPVFANPPAGLGSGDTLSC